MADSSPAGSPDIHAVSRKAKRRKNTTTITSPKAGGSAFQEIDVGRRLRELRSEKRLSLRTLAEMSGLNFNTLSLIENSKTSPSVGTLQQLASALEVPITAFFEVEPAQKSVVYQKSGQRPRAVFEHGLFEDLGAGLIMRGGQPLLVSLEVGSESGPTPIVHTGHEFVYCLEGRLTYLIEENVFHLEPGDSLIFEAHLPHRWWNQGDIPSRSLLILCPTDENDQPSKRHFPV
ncbi:MAG TPA: cupin domain-containing protein [Anaerolineales bacterium]|nr:cupin domain-containing protein [Anaerolineales bacterium]